MRLHRWKEIALDLLFPKFCVGCGAEGTFLCGACRSTLVWKTPSCPVCSLRNFTGVVCNSCRPEGGFSRFLAPFSYRDTLARELIHACKYGGIRDLAPLLAGEVAAFLTSASIHPAAGSMLVPIPLHRARERARGFNQSLLLAEALGQELGVPVAAAALARGRATESQISMESYEARRANVAGAFRVADPLAVRGRIAILVDDVSTSGATLNEASRALRAAGARTVWGIAVAKG